MKHFHHSLRSTQFGQGMTEYIIIVALIALAAIAAFSYFGGTVRGQAAQMSMQVAGQDGNDGIQAAQDNADRAVTEAQTDATLGDYDQRDAQGGLGGV